MHQTNMSEEKPKTTISACMIMKDEEEFLPDTLRALIPWVDEIIIVDTGSQDSSKKIATDFGVKVWEHPWQDDFSLHRNQSLSYASTDWVFVLDADERLDQESAPALRDLISKGDKDCFLVNSLSPFPSGEISSIWRPQVLRRQPELHFVNPVHEQPIFQGSAAFSPLIVHHKGYNLDPAKALAKKNRNLRMLHKWTQREPDNWYARRKYGGELQQGSQLDLERSLSEGKLAWQLAVAGGVDRWGIMYAASLVMHNLAFLGRVDELAGAVREALVVDQEHPDPLYFSCWLSFRHQDWPRTRVAAIAFLDALGRLQQKTGPWLFYDIATAKYVKYAKHFLIVSSASLGLYDEARRCFASLVDDRTHTDIGECLERTKQELINIGESHLVRELWNTLAGSGI